jgi:hypothetical protein
MNISGIDSWIQMLEWIAYNFYYCAFNFNSKYFTFDLSWGRIIVRNQERNDSDRCKIYACSDCSCPGQGVSSLMSRNEWIYTHGVIRLLLHTVLVFDNGIYSLFIATSCCETSSSFLCESICRSCVSWAQQVQHPVVFELCWRHYQTCPVQCHLECWEKKKEVTQH